MGVTVERTMWLFEPGQPLCPGRGQCACSQAPPHPSSLDSEVCAALGSGAQIMVTKPAAPVEVAALTMAVVLPVHPESPAAKALVTDPQREASEAGNRA